MGRTGRVKNYLFIILVLTAVVASGCSGGSGSGKEDADSPSNTAESNKLDQQRFDNATFE